MNFVTFQTSFTQSTRKNTRVQNENRTEPQQKSPPPKAKPNKAKLHGRFSEVTAMAIFLTMLAPLAAVACLAGLPAILAVAGAAAGLFGGSLLALEQSAIAR